MRESLTVNDLYLGRDERGAICGPSGCGKSELARHMLPPTGRLVILDPKRLFDYKVGVRIYDRADKLVKARDERVMYRPREAEFRDLEAYDKVLKFAYDQGDTFVYVDDMQGIMNRSQYPVYVQLISQMGRQKKVPLLVSFQRPSWIPGFLMSEANRHYAFRCLLPSDVKKLSEMIPNFGDKAVQDQLRQRYTFAYYNSRDSAMESCLTGRLKK